MVTIWCREMLCSSLLVLTCEWQMFAECVFWVENLRRVIFIADTRQSPIPNWERRTPPASAASYLIPLMKRGREVHF